MKIFLSYRSLLLLVLLLAGFGGFAQTDSTKNFIDSIKPVEPAVDTAVTTVADEPPAESSADDELVDTAVVSIYRSIDADTLRTIKRDEGFYYQTWLDSLLRAAANAKRPEPRKQRNIDLSGLDVFFNIFKIALLVAALSILAFVIYKLSSGSNALFLKSRKNIDVVVEKEEEVIDGKYDRLVKKAEAENNFRLAVRYLHLQALYNLSEKEYVRLATEKTNYQYLNELRSKSAPLTSLFSALTYKYEYIWYGEYSITSVQYDLLKNDFNEFNKEIDKR